MNELQYGTLHGVIKSEGTLKGSLSMSVGYTDYLGDYEVTPTIDSQTIPTADKRMIKDMVIDGIPCYEVSNEKGGTTFIIAEI